jgi:hypothetical protein
MNSPFLQQLRWVVLSIGTAWIMAEWTPVGLAGQDSCSCEFSPLAYETSAYELAPQWRAGNKRWSPPELVGELRRRAEWEKSRRELNVYYYRIGYTLAFPLPLSSRPDSKQFPAGIREIQYPWLTWLSWELDERWRILLAAWQFLQDNRAKVLLEKELTSLAWENYRGDGNVVGLPTGHLAGVFATVLSQADIWTDGHHTALVRTAIQLLDDDIAPWFEKTWADNKPITSPRLHNYVLILFRAAQLARVVNHPLAERLDRRAEDVFRAWCEARKPPTYHSEGIAYDGFLLDSVTEWLEGLPPQKKAELLEVGREPLTAFCRQAIALTLPGRGDLQAPLGDVEPEMTFWATALARVGVWYQLAEAGWLLQRFPLSRLRSAGLVELLRHQRFFEQPFPEPPAAPAEQLASVTLRTGFQRDDVLVAISLPRCQMGHLHADAGHVVIGWAGRFWITDPGYQQYRPGEERNYTIGPQAHNLPVIGGISASRRGGKLRELTAQAGLQRAVVDITEAYEKLPPGSQIHREVSLRQEAGGTIIIVQDSFVGLPAGTEIEYHWLGGQHLAWYFAGDQARLSDGNRSLWIAFSGSPIQATQLDRHPGSRGPLALRVESSLEGTTEITWKFVLYPSIVWQPIGSLQPPK